MKPLLLYILAISSVFTSHIHADLPPIKGDEWLGYFMASKNRKSLFGIAPNSESTFILLDKKGKPFLSSNPIKVNFQVIETTPQGTYTRKTIDTASLTSDSQPTANPRTPFTISGTVTDDATFQTTLKLIPVGFTASGQIKNNGQIKNPLFFGINIVMNPYNNIDFKDEKKAKEFRKEARRDKLEIITLTQEKKTYKLEDEVNFSTEFPNGVSSISLTTHRYENVEYIITATKGSAIHFQHNKQNPAYNHLNLLWKLNQGANPAAENLTMKAD